LAEYKIEHDRPGCIGCGSCAALCPNNWEMADDGKADEKKQDIGESELKENMDAAQSCPVNVIHIFEKSEKKLI